MRKSDPKIVDLTHALSPEAPSWDGGCGFELETVLDYEDGDGLDRFRAQEIKTRAGMGTHMDAPAHCFPEGKTIDQLDLAGLVVDCVVIKAGSTAGEDHVFMPETVEKFEKKNGRIQPGTLVIFHSGWDKYWNTPGKYRNDLIFPSVHEGTAKLLLERDIAGLGIDTLSPDARGESFPVHRAVLGAGKYLVENIANAGKLPATGTKILAMPIKIKEATEAPIRLIALI